MKGPPKSNKAKSSEGATPGASVASTAAKSIDPVAVVALSESGEILAAREACGAIFGRDPASLVGQNICILLKDGFDNDVGRFLHRHRAGKNPAGTIAMRVLALRKDGSEFLAQVTTLTWNWDTAVSRKADVSRLCWTAAFRDLGAAPMPSPRRTSDESRVDRGSPGKNEQLVKSSAVISLTENETVLEPQSGDESAVLAVAAKPEPENASPQPMQAAPAVPAQVEVAKAQGELPCDDAKSGRTAAQVVALDLRRQLEELEVQLKSATSELERVKAESENRGRGEAELRTQLEAAKEAVGYAEAALREEIARKEKAEERLQNLSNSLRQEQAERSKRFEAELINLRQERDELNVKLTADQESAGEATRRASELELQLSRNAAEFERARRELEQQSAERQRSESVWREQLDTAWIAKKELEGAWAGAVEQNKKFEEELAKLRQEHDELNARLAAEQKTADESKRRAKDVENRLNRNAADSDRARGELDKQNAERERIEAEWREQLEAAKEAKTKLESALAEAAARSKRFEDELATLRRERDELDGRLAAEQKAVAAARARIKEVEARLGRESGDVDPKRTKLETDRANAKIREHVEVAKELKASVEEAAARSKRAAEEAENFRRERDLLQASLSAEQQALAESKERECELDGRLSASNVEVERLRSELERQSAGHKQACAELSKQFEATRAEQAKTEALFAEATERHQRVTDELAAVRQERDELKLRLKAERQSAVESGQRAEDLHRRLNQNASELERFQAEVETLSAEREQAELRWNEQQKEAKEFARKLEADWAGALERNVRLEEELAGLRQERDEVAVQLKSERQNSTELTRRADDLERRMERCAAELKRATAEIEKLRVDRDRADSAWSEQLESAKALAKKLEVAWTGATDRSRRIEAEVANVREERQELQGKLALARQDAAKSKELTDNLEGRANRTAAELERLKADLDGLRAEKVELGEILSGSVERNRRLEAELSALRRDLSKSAGHQAPPKPEPPPNKTAPKSTETAVPAIPKASELERVQADLAKAAARQPGQVQQYSFEQPKGEARRSEARSSRRKLQP